MYDWRCEGWEEERLDSKVSGPKYPPPGCATQGETMEELRFNLREAIEGCLSVPIETSAMQTDDQVIELAL